MSVNGDERWPVFDPGDSWPGLARSPDEAPADFPTIEFDGVPRALAAIDGTQTGLFASAPRWADRNDVIDPKDWVEVDFSAYDPDVMDQGQTNSCNGHALAGIFGNCWNAATGNAARLDFDPFWIYGQCNGGRDAGSSPTEGIAAMQSVGMIPRRLNPRGLMFPRQFPPEWFNVAGNYRIDAYLKCPSFEEVASAILRRRPVDYGIAVGGNFATIDAGGVAGVPTLVEGLHAIYAAGLVRVKAGPYRGEWALVTRNSWGPRYGVNGSMLIVREHFDRSTYREAVAVVAPNFKAPEGDDFPAAG